MENKYGVEFGYSYDKYGCNTKYCNIKLCENQLISITYDIFTEYIEYHQKLIPYGIIRFEYEDYKSEIKIIRIVKKCQLPGMPFGTSVGYLVPAILPSWIDGGLFKNILKDACEVLRINHSICNVDLMITGNEIIFLEITPRPGGDFIPLLIKKSCGLDILGLALDFAEGKEISIPPREKWRNLAGLRLFANRQGILKSINITELENDNRVLDVILIRKPGDTILLPPDDYDTWLLGYLIFEPNDESLEYQCVELRKKLTTYLDLLDGQKSVRNRSQDSGTVESADTKTR